MIQVLPSLHYMPGDRWFPDHSPQTVTAVPFLQIDPSKSVHLEGLAFDQNGDLLCCNIYDSILYWADMKTKKVSAFYEFEDKSFSPTAIKVHKDGRIFVAGTDMKSKPLGMGGGIVSMNPDGTDVRKIVTGWNADDLVFDQEGGFYFANYIGNPQHRTGTIEYVSPDFKTITNVVSGLASPNGLALSPDGAILWVTETAAGMLNRIVLASQHHNTTPYKFEGFYGPDSCNVDEDGNLYVAMSRQGRIMVFNPNGMLIGKVYTPGRDEGRSLGTTHPMVHPDEKVLYFTAHDINFDTGANIFRCGAFAKGFRGFQYQK